MVGKFPRYFIVDFEIFVKVSLEENCVIGINHLGSHYSPMKALVEGQEITKKEYLNHIYLNNKYLKITR